MRKGLIDIMKDFTEKQLDVISNYQSELEKDKKNLGLVIRSILDNHRSLFDNLSLLQLMLTLTILLGDTPSEGFTIKVRKKKEGNYTNFNFKLAPEWAYGINTYLAETNRLKSIGETLDLDDEDGVIIQGQLVGSLRRTFNIPKDSKLSSTVNEVVGDSLTTLNYITKKSYWKC